MKYVHDKTDFLFSPWRSQVYQTISLPPQIAGHGSVMHRGEVRGPPSMSERLESPRTAGVTASHTLGPSSSWIHGNKTETFIVCGPNGNCSLNETQALGAFKALLSRERKPNVISVLSLRHLNREGHVRRNKKCI
jgi:hypothetical protein